MMKISKWIIIGTMAVMGLTGCKSSDTKTETTTDTQANTNTQAETQTNTVETTVGSGSAYHKITSEEAKNMMDAGGVTIVDVRTAAEYADGHVPDAINVPNEEIGQDAPEELPDKTGTILVYCRSGKRSKDASDKLVKAGYENIYDFGGIIDWPYETVK